MDPIPAVMHCPPQTARADHLTGKCLIAVQWPRVPICVGTVMQRADASGYVCASVTTLPARLVCPVATPPTVPDLTTFALNAGNDPVAIESALRHPVAGLNQSAVANATMRTDNVTSAGEPPAAAAAAAVASTPLPLGVYR